MPFAQLREFWRNESAATAVEYGLFAALMSMAGIAAFTAIGETLEVFFESVDTEISNASN